MKKLVKSFHFWLLVAVVTPFVTVSTANIAGLDWVIFKDEVNFASEALLILLFFAQIIIATRTFGFKGGIIGCFALGALMYLQVINGPRSDDYLLGFAGIIGMGISVSLLIDRQEKERNLLEQRAEERERQAVELSCELIGRKQVEEALRKSEERHKELADFLPQIVVETDESGNITFVNQQAFQSTGYTPDDFSNGLHAAQLVIPEDRDRVKQNIRRVLSGQKKGGTEYSALRKDGSTFPIIVYTAPIIREGKPMGLRGIIIDITERKQMEEQLRHSQILASLGEMTAGIAHEVNNPLSSILLYSELMMSSGPLPSIKKDLKVIHSEAKRAAKIMTDLLAYSRKLTPHMRRLNLHSILKKVLDMRRYQQSVHNVTASTNLLEDPLYIEGNSSQLMQVFLNLIINAEEALRKHNGGNIKVTTEADGEWAKVSIADDGTGIPEDKLSQVFHPFFTTKRIGEGTGLGLSTCYGITIAHGGLIHAENNDMGGATFIMEIPLVGKGRQAILPLETEDTSSQSHNQNRQIQEVAMAASNPLVLVVDDEPRMCDVIERILKEEGYKVITAPDGETAFRLIPEKKPNILLLDLLMPGIDGREVCRRIRELSTKTQIIYFTAKVEQDPAKLKELRSEADAFIAKPATSKQILFKVSRVLQGARQ